MFHSLYSKSVERQLQASWALGTQGAIDEARGAALGIIASAQSADDRPTEACASLQVAWFCFQTGDVEPGLEHATAARRIFQTLASLDGEAAAGALAAWLLLEAGASDEASEDAGAALALLDTTSDSGILGFVTNVLGVILWSCRQLEQAIPLCEEAVGLAERAHDPVATAWWRINLAGVHAELGHRAIAQDLHPAGMVALATAISINDAALAMALDTGDLWCQHLALCNAAEYLCAARRIDEAQARLAACEALAPLPQRRSRTHYLLTKAEVLFRADRAVEALQPCREALRIAEPSGDAESKMRSFRHLSMIHEELGAFADALACFKQFFAAHQVLTTEKAQRLARMAGLRYETHKLRAKADAAEAQVASLVLTSRSDPLTGIANRRAFDATLAALSDHPRAYALAIIDLDHFKQINDRFSHLVGDAVLKQVGAILTACCPQGDLVARLGGEEFALIVADAEDGHAAWLCEALRQKIATCAWRQHHPQLMVTTSIGLAHHFEAATPTDVLALADRRLYQAKTMGRNRVVSGSVDPQWVRVGVDPREDARIA